MTIVRDGHFLFKLDYWCVFGIIKVWTNGFTTESPYLENLPLEVIVVDFLTLVCYNYVR